MLISFLRTVVLYLLLIVTVRLMGKRQIGEMEPAEFVVTMLLANLAAIPMQDSAIPLLSGLVPILVILGLELILAAVSLQSIRMRRLLCGKPVILMQNGKILERNLQRTRVNLDELTMHLREKGIFDLSTVKFAILETNGQLSTLLYAKEQPASARDAGHPRAGDGAARHDHIRRAHSGGKSASGRAGRRLARGRAEAAEPHGGAGAPADDRCRGDGLSCAEGGLGMKLCWFGCGILAVLLALSLLCGMLTQRSTRDAAAALELALDALDRDETAQAVEAGAQARQHWQRHRRFLCAVLSHDELDGIEQGFAELRAYSAVGDAAELRSRCEVLLLQLQHIAQLDAPYAENFLTCPVRI